jgi:CHASE2 domain-containing sensor protein
MKRDKRTKQSKSHRLRFDWAKKKEFVGKRLRIFWQDLRKTTIAIITAIPITLLLGSIGTFQYLERPILDLQMSLNPAPVNSNIVIVRITDEDYKNYFKAESPLHAQELEKIINALARGGPKVIGVDIDTSPSHFQNLNIVPGNVPIIWAREATYSNREKQFYLSKILGGTASTPAFGLVMLKPDKDGTVRRYTRTCKTNEGFYPSFAWAVAKEFLSMTNVDEESQNERLINFRGDPLYAYRFDLPVSKILEHAADQSWPSNEIIKDKIVLLGGSYYGQDEHKTPLGWLVGVEVMAQIVETELQGGGAKSPSSVRIILLGMIAGLILWLLFHFLSLRTFLLLSLIVIPCLALICSVIAFGSISQCAYFIPILLAVLGQQFFERLKESKKTPVEQAAAV